MFTARHPPDRNLPLKLRAKAGRQLVKVAVGDIREIDADEQLEELGGLGEFVERVKPRLTTLLIQQLDERAREIPNGFVRFDFLPERK